MMMMVADLAFDFGHSARKGVDLGFAGDGEG